MWPKKSQQVELTPQLVERIDKLITAYHQDFLPRLANLDEDEKESIRLKGRTIVRDLATRVQEQWSVNYR